MGFGFGCGCCGACIIIQDLFTRPNASSLGEDWLHVSGNWSIFNNDARVTTANSVVRCNAESNLSPSINLSVAVSTTTAGSTARIYIDYADLLNCVFAEMKFGPNPYLRLYRRTAGADTLLAEVVNFSWGFTTGLGGTLEICYDSRLGEISANVNSIGTALVVVAGSVTNHGFALGTGATVNGSVTFASVSALNVGYGCNICSRACLSCVADSMRQFYQIELAGVTGSDCCGAANSTFIISRPGGAGTCYYATNLPTGLCNDSFPFIPVHLLAYPGPNRVILGVGLFNQYIEFRGTLAGSAPPYNCNLDGYTLNYYADGSHPSAQCTGGTAKIRAI